MTNEEIGDMLEHAGMSNEQIDAYFEHHGVKGMHWGRRGTNRVQKQIDITRRVAAGKGSNIDKVRLGLTTNFGDIIQNKSVNVQKTAKSRLANGAKLQAKVNNGQKKATNVLLTAQGIKIKDLNFSPL